jgi:hypothetical protein
VIDACFNSEPVMTIWTPACVLTFNRERRPDGNDSGSLWQICYRQDEIVNERNACHGALLRFWPVATGHFFAQGVIRY